MIQQQGDAAKIAWIKETHPKLSAGELLHIPGLTSLREASKALMEFTEPKARTFIATDFDRKAGGSPSSWDHFEDYASENKGDAWFVDARTDANIEKVAVWSFEPWRAGAEGPEGEPVGKRIVVSPARHDEKREKMEEAQYVEERKKYWKEKREKEDAEDKEDEEAEEEEEGEL